jgi:glycerophosphoryl diester phosphodiesterase
VTTIIRSPFPFAAALLIVAALTAAGPAAQSARPKQAIAHRGASGYAPEHTAAAYKLAMDMKTDFVEPDLAVSKDNVLFCMHDDTLERTTDVAQVFPDRVSTNYQTRQPGKHWVGNDFTMAELKRLDSGKWFKPEFAGQHLLSFQEMIDLVKARPGFGIYPELKSPELYNSRGVDQEKLFVGVIKKNGLEKPASLKTFPVIIQSFDETAIHRVAVDLPTIPRVFLTQKDEDVTEARIKELATFATGIAPEKFVIARHPEMVARAHAAGLTVTSWTFRADDKEMKYPSVNADMTHFMYVLGIDALFNNNPDQFPRR